MLDSDTDDNSLVMTFFEVVPCVNHEEAKIPFWSKHLREVGESYIAHGLTAFSLAIMLALSAVAQFVHAVLPFVRPPMGTDICSLLEYLEAKKPEVRAQCKEE